MRGYFKSSQAVTIRKYAREWVESYPSIAKIYEAIAGVRRMVSEGTVEAYIKGVRAFVKYLGYQDPETALTALKSVEVDAEQKVDTFIDCALEEQNKAHSHVRNQFLALRSGLNSTECMLTGKR